MTQLERIPADEQRHIENIIRLTVEQLESRYGGGTPRMRAQHAKGHACVTGTFRVADDLPPSRRIGIFSTPRREYQAWIRYSNAAAEPGADSPMVGGVMTHGSRGMAIKIMGVDGVPLMPDGEPGTQDFLMVNHPVFPFADAKDYDDLTEVIAKDEKPDRFFAERIHGRPGSTPDPADPARIRALRTLGIVQRIQSSSFTPGPTAPPSAFQAPPASPVDNDYFGAAAFLFGDGAAMRISAKPRSPVMGDSQSMTDEDYMRAALRERLAAGAQIVVFDFQVQVRTATELADKIDTQIEDACVEWDETAHPFETIATITIPPQEFDTAEQRAACEDLFFTPWHGIAEHRPLGGINRLRRAVYEASSMYRRGANSAAQS